MTERPDLAALEEQVRQGHAAQEKIAAYYESLTFEELEAEFSQGEPVTVLTPPEGIRVSFGVSFIGEDLHGLLKAVRTSGKSPSQWIHDIAVKYSQRCPRCGDTVPEENDDTGEGPVYWTRSDLPFCSMECVVAQEREYLGRQSFTD